MKPEPNIPDDLRPLGLAKGYLISADGRVFNERTRREAKSFTLRQASMTARKSMTFDPARMGDRGADELVCDDLVAVRFQPGSTERVPVFAKVTRWVRVIPPDGICLDLGPDGEPAFRRDHPDGRIEWIEDRDYLPRCEIDGGAFPAHGDTGRHWLYLAADATDPRCKDSVLMHGPSVAHKLFTGA